MNPAVDDVYALGKIWSELNLLDGLRDNEKIIDSMLSGTPPTARKILELLQEALSQQPSTLSTNKNYPKAA